MIELHMTFVPVDFIVMDMRSNTSSPINLSDKTNHLLYEYKKNITRNKRRKPPRTKKMWNKFSMIRGTNLSE
jgi:hypothetical protein